MEQAALHIGAALLLARAASAQNNNNNNNQQAGGTPTAAAQQTQPAQQNTAAGNNNGQNTPTAAANPAQQGTTTTQGPSIADGPSVVITGIPTGSTSQPVSSGSSTVSSFGGLTGLPTIAGYGIPSMVVPDTSAAPFMKVSHLPEGTVFIVVGACLAAIGVAVLLWRGLIAWSIHRSVKRANEKLSSNFNTESHKLVKPGVGGAAHFTNGSNLSMDHLRSAPGGSMAKKNLNATPRSNIASNAAAARSSSLFFSPTAGNYNNNASHSSVFLSGNRSSSFLPSGFYAAPGANSPAGGAQATQIGGGSGGVTPLRPPRHSRYHDVSPPESPGLPPSSHGLPPSSHGMDSIQNRRTMNSSIYHQPSTSTLNLNVPGNAHPGGRAPSANLDDMLGDYPLGNVK